jgi:hypothetical protein
MRILFPALIPAMALAAAIVSARADATDAAAQAAARAISDQQVSTMKIRMDVNGTVITATLADNETARDFASLLPLTLTMNDLFGREKFAPLPRPISTAGPRSRTYEVGDVILWSPGTDVAIFYRHDGQTIPSPGSILLAKVDSGVEALNVPGSVRVTVELIEK